METTAPITDNQTTSAYKQHEDLRQNLSQIVDQTYAVLSKTTSASNWSRNRDEIKKRLLSDFFEVMVLGEFKRGKSTFINSLLGAKVLPAFHSPTTAILSIVKYGTTPHAMVYFKDGKAPLKIRTEEIESYVRIPKDSVYGGDEIGGSNKAVRESPYDRVEIFWDLELCKNGVSIIDSPGLNEDDTRSKITSEYLSKADAVVFMQMCDAALSKNERQYIENVLLPAGHSDVFFVCNKINLIEPSEQDEVKTSITARLRNYTAKNSRQRIFFVNAKGALDSALQNDPAARKGSGIPEFESELSYFLVHERGKSKIINGCSRVREALRTGRSDLRHESEMLLRSGDELNAAYQREIEPLQQLEKDRANVEMRMVRFRTELRQRVGDKVLMFLTQKEKEILTWTDELELINHFNFFTLQTTQAQVTAITEEVIEKLNSRLQDEFAAWQNQELVPFITKQIEDFQEDLEERSKRFVQDLNSIQSRLSGFHPDSESDAKDIHWLERVLAAGGGLILLGPGGAITGGAGGFKGMLKGALPMVAIGILAGLGVVTLPLALAAMIGTGIYEMVRGGSKKTEEIKHKIASEFALNMSKESGRRASEVAASVDETVGKLEAAVSSGLQGLLSGARKSVESVLEMKKKGESESVARRGQIELAQNEIDRLEGRVDEVMTRVMGAL